MTQVENAGEKSIRRASCCGMKVREAVQTLSDELNIAESELTIFFCSPSCHRKELQAALNEATSCGQIVGCTSAGEIGLEGYAKMGFQQLKRFSPMFLLKIYSKKTPRSLF